MHDIIIENNVSADIGGLIVLELTDNYILQQLKENSRMSEFIFGNAALDSHSLMLYKEGVGVDYLTHTATVCVCDQCMVFLKVATVPKFALKNHLYRGYLPSEFSDITWVEEMAVAIYHSTAFITQLYFLMTPRILMFFMVTPVPMSKMFCQLQKSCLGLPMTSVAQSVSFLLALLRKSPNPYLEMCFELEK